jgi:hypothetical protein
MAGVNGVEHDVNLGDCVVLHPLTCSCDVDVVWHDVNLGDRVLLHPLTCSCEVDVFGDEGEKSAVEK